jgi:hypothetical protein
MLKIPKSIDISCATGRVRALDVRRPENGYNRHPGKGNPITESIFYHEIDLVHLKAKPEARG